MHGIHHLPPGATGLFAGPVSAATLFGLIGVALGYITRSTIAAVVGAVGWVLFVELAILHNLAPHLAKWLITGSALTLTNPPMQGNGALTPPPPSRCSPRTRSHYSSSPVRSSCAET